ncbi:hypothetical protein [Streptosporangium sandarakinum]
MLTPGQAGDGPQFARCRSASGSACPSAVRVPGRGAVAADKAYSSRGNRAHLCKRGIEAVIPEKADRAAHHRKRGSRGGHPVRHDPDLYKERNAVERCVNRVKEWRGPSFRFDKTPGSYPAGLHLRGAVLWVRSLRPA